MPISLHRCSTSYYCVVRGRAWQRIDVRLRPDRVPADSHAAAKDAAIEMYPTPRRTNQNSITSNSRRPHKLGTTRADRGIDFP